MTKFHRPLVLCCSVLALSACGADEIASPGSGGDIIINNPTPTPSPAPSPTGGASPVTAAASCPTISDGLTDSGVLNVPGGTVRVCTLPRRFTASTTLPYISGVAYRMNGRVDVGTDGGPTASANDTNVTLTIEPGVVVYAGTGLSYLVVNRANKINAVGTATQPVIFTSEQNVLGNATDDSSQQWGGVVLLGRAPITDCAAGGATPGTVDCERDTEGSPDPALYGGATPTDSSGKLQYVQIRYSGFVLSANSELQSLTTGGTGSGTELSHIMSFNSSDDAFEFFGGVVNAKYLVAVGAEDDVLDTDTGVQAQFQYVLSIQREGQGDSMIEADTNNSSTGHTPRQDTVVSNATFIQRSTAGSNNAAMLIRGGADYKLLNTVVHSPNRSCLRLSLADTIQQTGTDENGPPEFRSVVMQCASPAFLGTDGVTEADVQSIFNAGTNNNANFTTTLASGFINGSNESAVTPFNASTISSFFDNTSYIGAVRDSSDTWYTGWTCNSAAANLGASNKACTTSPVT
ncbi:hypothetical protein U8326_11495 [Tsuneonella sp. CC-YZS046]|uniref:hypothetical protein n=1 Tax=Tsuneonella sp. CC-YZS046 TaxID=3042152 RepID=UPI002D77954F|nr:hypothetical protein [Tsuneonella sp. CC-YZS046]WRO65674.1 hypothetical protein U8326_11495 [Tsuneonella sp. CC-YZS046]